MTVLLADLKTIAAKAFSSYTVSAADWLVYIDSALRLYSRYKPFVLSTSFETVADQAEYELDEDFDFLLEVHWSGSSLTSALATMELATGEEVGGAWQVTSPVISRIQGEVVTGRWYQRGESVVLEPTPETSGLTVDVLYGLIHTLNEEGDAYETVPTADTAILVDLVVAEVLDLEANNAAVEPDYAEGQQKTYHHFRAEAAARRVQELRRKALAHLERDQMGFV